MSNKKASIIAIIVVIVGFFIYDRFKPLSEEKLISKQGLVTVYLDNSYKNIDSTQSPEGTLLAQYSQRHGLTVTVSAGHLTATEAELSLQEYSNELLNHAPHESTLNITALEPDTDEIFYTLTLPQKLYSWQRLKKANDRLIVISVSADDESAQNAANEILKHAEFNQL